MFIPYEVETLTQRKPISNIVILALNVAVYVAMGVGLIPGAVVEKLTLTKWAPIPLLSYQFLHDGLAYLLSNMIVLWVFGNALCSNTSNLIYPFAYLGLGAAAGALHLYLTGDAVVGSSGAISGILGFYVALYPLNRVHCFYFFGFRWHGTCAIRGYALVLIWFVLDLAMLVRTEGTVAYWAHIGGLGFGFIVGLWFLSMGVVKVTEYDNPTVIDIFRRRKGGMGNGREIRFKCPHCVEPLVASPPDKPGDLLDCPECGKQLMIPRQSR